MKTTVKIFGIIALAAIAVFFTACPENFGLDSRQGLASGEFIPVEEITGIPTGTLLYVATPLTGTVMPRSATNKRIEWSIAEDSELQPPDAELNGNNLTANEEGIVTVRATIRNGLAEGVDFTQDFPILIFLAENTVAVRFISGITEELTFGEIELRGTVVPSNAINTTIVWHVKNAGEPARKFTAITLPHTHVGRWCLPRPS